jgi:hypothetical protein
MFSAVALAADAPAVLQVAADGSAEFKSIQAAIDAAPAGAVIRVAAGTYAGPLRITRPVTIEGAGWQHTHVRGEWIDLHSLFDGSRTFQPEAKQRLDELVERIKKSDGDKYARAMEELWNEFGAKSLLSVEGSTRVALKGLRFSYLGRVQDGGWMSMPAVRFDNSSVVVESCALVGSAVEGLLVENAADVQIRDSLFAGIRGTGIAANIPTTSRVLVKNCEIRNCGYAGVSVEGDGLVEVDGCRIAGIEFHAFRYDDASPRIIGNVLTDINRGGIYTDGESRATIRNNLFLGCSFSARGANRDVLENNTFYYARPHPNAAWDDDTAAWFNGEAAPEVRGNVFARYEHALTLSPEAAGKAIIESNVFDTKGSTVVGWIPPLKDAKDDPGKYQDLPLPAGNLTAKVVLVDEANDDFALAPGIVPAGRQIGVAGLRSVASAWPEVAEERELLDRLARARKQQR